jgi:hypothetical protein
MKKDIALGAMPFFCVCGQTVETEGRLKEMSNALCSLQTNPTQQGKQWSDFPIKVLFIAV